MDICEKIAYIKGLAEGLNIEEKSKEGKVLLAVIELLEDITAEICDIEDACDDMSEQIDAVDEDLAALEDIIYEDDCDCGCDCDDDCDCDCCDDDDLYEIECPACQDVIYLDSQMLEEEGINCPNCGTPLEFDFDCDCGCCDDESDCCADGSEE